MQVRTTNKYKLLTFRLGKTVPCVRLNAVIGRKDMTHFRVVYMRGREGKRYTCMYRVGSNVIPAVDNCAEIITRKLQVLYIGHNIYFRMVSGCQ